MNFTQHVFGNCNLDHNALIYNDSKITYRNLRELTGRYYNFLRQKNIKAGDEVCISLPDSPNFVALILANWAIGAKTAHPNLSIKGKQLSEIVETYKPKLIITDEKNSERFSDMNYDLECLEQIDNENVIIDYHRYKPDETLWYQMSSGTTGRSKMVRHTITNAFEWHKSWNNSTQGNSKDLVYVTGKLQFNYSFGLTILNNLLNGSCAVIHDGIPTPKLIENIFKNNKITRFYIIPTFINLLCKSKRDINFKNCVTVSSSGDFFPEFMYEKFFEIYGVKVQNIIGCSDCCHNYTFNSDYSYSLGKPLQYVEIKIVDEKDNECPINTVGEILVKAPFIGKGYLHDIKNTSKAFVNDYVKTNDLGMMDSKGRLHFKGRKNNIIKINSIFVNPIYTEKEIIQYPGISDCQVVFENNTLMANLVTDSKINMLGLKKFLQEKLEPQQVPKKFNLVENIASTWNGKKIRQNFTY